VRSKEDTRLVEVIRHLHAASGSVYGARNLQEAGETCGRSRVARPMQVNKDQGHMRLQSVSKDRWATFDHRAT
jgi:hypothetical protein